MSTALLLIDLQNDYFPGGKMELVGAQAAAVQAARLLTFFRGRGWPVVHVQHVSTRPGASFFLPGTDGVRHHPSVAPLDGEPVVVKHFPNAFRETDLDARLRALGVDQLAVAGMMTHMCVDAGVRAAADLGYSVLLAADACATRDLAQAGVAVPAAQVQAAFLAALGSYAAVLPVDELLGRLSA